MNELDRLAAMHDLEKRLLDWRAANVLRNALLTEAAAAGISSQRISLLTGISRQTVWRILNGNPRAERQAPR